MAKKYNFIYVDTGAIYRTVGLAARRSGVGSKDAEGIIALLPSVQIDVSYDNDGTQVMLLCGENVSREIRLPEISIYASDVSAIPEVRAFLLEMQRDMARKHDVVMDGRDIGTVVLPGAQVKIFLTASAEVRAKRRWLELRERGTEAPFDEVLRDIEYRDAQDSTRAAAPLKPAEDAVTVDTSGLDFPGSIAAVCAVIDARIGK